MDEFYFRSSQRFENFQYQLGIAATESKQAVLDYSQILKHATVRIINSEKSVQIKESVRQFWQYIITIADEIKCEILYHLNPKKVLRKIALMFGTKWTKRDLYFGCAGLALGGIIGICLGLALRRRYVYRYMHAVQCTSYTGIQGATFIDEIISPQTCGKNELLISVKAGSVQTIDADLCDGYGQTIRRLLSKYYHHCNYDLPFTLGRDCTGIVTDIGQNVCRFEIGDEVWLTAPFWAPGTLSQTVLASENNVAKKPRTIGFERACSLPYPGCVAFATFKKAGLDKNNAENKRVFVQSGCTPVGCIMLQVLKHWKAHVTTSCSKRATPVALVLGADDVISRPSEELVNLSVYSNSDEVLLKELQAREKFDYIFSTKRSNLSHDDYRGFCSVKGVYFSCIHENLLSDKLDFVTAFFYGFYVRMKCFAQTLFGFELHDFGETHMCYLYLDELRELVDAGYINTLVMDRIFNPMEIEKALNHIRSDDSVGSTIITFR